MKQRLFLTTTGAVFFLIAALHLLRLLLGFEAIIGSWHVPLWVSWIAIAVSGYLAYTACRLRR